MIFFERERSQVRTLRVSFREIARIFGTLGGFNLGWHWLSSAFTNVYSTNPSPLATGRVPHRSKKAPIRVLEKLLREFCARPKKLLNTFRNLIGCYVVSRARRGRNVANPSPLATGRVPHRSKKAPSRGAFGAPAGILRPT